MLPILSYLLGHISPYIKNRWSAEQGFLVVYPSVEVATLLQELKYADKSYLFCLISIGKMLRFSSC